MMKLSLTRGARPATTQIVAVVWLSSSGQDYRFSRGNGVILSDDSQDKPVSLCDPNRKRSDVEYAE
jgi:hypothetical protein